MGAANIGLGIDKAKKFTVNPLVYLDKLASRGTASAPQPTVVANTPPVNNTPQSKPVTDSNVAPAKPASTPSTPQVAKVVRKDAEIVS